jgi:7-cyano-7-deazaguanine synthase
MHDIVVLLSGGLDSTVLAASALKVGRLRACICFRYGQPHMEAEMLAARKWCSDHGVARVVVDVPLPGGSAMHTGVGTPGPRVMPGRNLVLIAHAVQYAAAVGAAEVHIGACADDHAAYPDCRPDFVEAAGVVARTYGVEVCAPYLHLRKSDIVGIAHGLGVDIGATWSCYEPRSVGMGFEPCERCNACVLRASARGASGFGSGQNPMPDASSETRDLCTQLAAVAE